MPKLTEVLQRTEEHSQAAQEVLDKAHAAITTLLNLQVEAEGFNGNETSTSADTSSSMYPLVIAHLKEKYGDTQALIDRLLSKLQSTKARSDRLDDQGWLCEQLQSIISQLELKGEHTNNTFLQKQLLAKFAVDIQRQVLRQKATLEAEGRWNTMNLLKSAKNYIAAELKIISQTEHRTQLENGKLRSTDVRDKRSFKEAAKFQPRPCFYCRKPGHQARKQ
ncbi:hypothetical protein OSTOST_17504 [Ostertagia ostertagi]